MFLTVFKSVEYPNKNRVFIDAWLYKRSITDPNPAYSSTYLRTMYYDFFDKHVDVMMKRSIYIQSLFSNATYNNVCTQFNELRSNHDKDTFVLTLLSSNKLLLNSCNLQWILFFDSCFTLPKTTLYHHSIQKVS